MKMSRHSSLHRISVRIVRRLGRLALAVLLALGALPVYPATPALADSATIFNIAPYSNPVSIPGSEAPRLVVSDLTKGPGVFRDSYFNGVKAGFLAAAGWTTSSTRNASDYIQFTVTAANRFSIDYNSITYGLFVQDSGNPSDYKGPRTWELRYSTDGFASDDHLLDTHSNSYSNASALVQTTYTTDLSSIGTTGQTVTFRLYGYYSQGSETGSAGGFAISSGATYKPYLNWTGTGSNVILDYTPIETTPNTAPVVSDFTKEGAENTTLELAEADFSSHYSDFDDELMTRVKIVALPAHGTLTLDGSNVTTGQEIATSDLDTLDFAPDTGWSGTTTFDWNASDGGLYATSDATVTLSLQAMNDAPVNTVPGPQTADEDTDTLLGAISVTDTDAGDGQIRTTLSVAHGTLTVTTGNATVSNNGTASVRLDGTLTQVNATLDAGVTYRGDSNYAGTDTLTVTTNDNGNTGNGGALSDTDTVSITVNGTQDAPTVADFSVSGSEDNAITFAESNFANTFDDPDMGDSLQTVRIDTLPAQGDLQLNGSDVSLNQEIAAGDLGNLSYSPDADKNGSDSFDWNGSDGTEYASMGATVSITVTAVNDGPVNSVPGPQTVDEDTNLSIAELSISDIDAGSNDVQTTVAATHGVVTVTTNLPGGVPAGDVTGNGTASVVIIGTLSEINTTLGDGVTYRGEQDYSGPDTLTMTTNDQGHTGSGGASSDVDTVNITVNPVPDAPIVNDFGKTTNEDTTRSFAQSDFENAYYDGDGDSLTTVRIDSLPAHGDLQLNASDVSLNQEIAAGDLGNLTYSPDANWNGSDSFDWNGSDGSAYASASATVEITVTAVNDAPVNSVPGAQTVDEDTDLSIEGLSISDLDAGSNDVQTTLAVGQGVVTVTTDLSGGAPAGDITGNGTASVVVNGTLSEINTTLGDGITYRGALNYHGPDSLTMTTNDQGHGGDGGPLSDTDTVDITVDSVPDAPVVEDFGKSTNEDTPVSFAASSDFETHFSDGDNDSISAVRIDSLPAHGTLQLSGSDVTAHQEIPAGELNNLAYIPDANWNGADSFDWNAYDGSLYAESNATITISVSAVNDGPIQTVPGAQTVDEDTDLNIAGLSISDVDAGSNDIQTTLAVSHGVVTVAIDLPGGAPAGRRHRQWHSERDHLQFSVGDQHDAGRWRHLSRRAELPWPRHAHHNHQ